MNADPRSCSKLSQSYSRSTFRRRIRVSAGIGAEKADRLGEVAEVLVSGAVHEAALGTQRGGPGGDLAGAEGRVQGQICRVHHHSIRLLEI